MTASMSINLSTDDPGLFHSTVAGRLSCLRVLSIVDTVAMNIGVHVSFQCMVFSVCPGVGLLDHMVALFLIF